MRSCPLIFLKFSTYLRSPSIDPMKVEESSNYFPSISIIGVEKLLVLTLCNPVVLPSMSVKYMKLQPTLA